MSTKMTRDERNAFLAGLHVGVIAIEQEGAPPLSAPIWYDYTPERGVWVITGPNSAKGRCLEKAGRFSLVAQTEAPPTYQYVSVEGPIVETRPADIERDSRPMARRYFGQRAGDAFVEATASEPATVYVMRPERVADGRLREVRTGQPLETHDRGVAHVDDQPLSQRQDRPDYRRFEGYRARDRVDLCRIRSRRCAGGARFGGIVSHRKGD